MSGGRSRLRNVLEYGAARTVVFVLNLMPEAPAYWVVGLVGRTFFRLAKGRQRVALQLLHNAYPEGRSDAELLAIARTATGNIFKVALDTVRAIPWLESGRIAERIDVSQVADVLPAPPFLALSPHLGSWEISGLVAAMLRGESHAIAREFENPLLQRFILGNRQRAGLFVHPKRGGIRSLVRALEQGHVGMQVADQHQRLRGVWVPFFGRLASTERSAAVLSLRHGYPIAVGCSVRVGGGFRFKVQMLPPFTVTPTDDHEADIKRVAAEVNRRFEQLILAYPEQYLWIHRRYREVPPEVMNETS